MVRPSTLFLLAAAVVVAQACRRDPDLAAPDAEGGTNGPTPLTLDVPVWALDTVHPLNLPWDNPLTVEGVALGRKLFYEKAFSDDHTMSCATCHRQEHAFTDPRTFSIGTNGAVGRRNAMPIMNAVWDHFFFWDARAMSLELQAFKPVVDHNEMRNTWPVVAERLAADPEYPPLFEKAFGPGMIDSLHIVYAIAQFERTLLSFNSRFDDFYFRGQTSALTEQEQRGLDLFIGEAHCNDCHMLPLLHDHSVRNNGLGPDPNDAGLFEVSGVEAHRWRFKTPSLRNVEVTAPYMHNGRMATLEEVVTFYANSVRTDMPTLDEHMQPWVWGQIDLSADEQADLVAFLRSLTDQRFLTDPAFSDPH